MNRSLSVIMPNYKGEKLIPKYLPSLIDSLNNYAGNYEIIIVDDNSTDGSIDVIKQYSGVKLIKLRENSGFAHACNVGLKAAQYETLFFLNNDVRITKGFFNYFSGHFDNSSVFAVTVKSFRISDGRFLDGGKVGMWNNGMWRVSKNYDVSEIENNDFKKPYLSFCVQGAFFFTDKKKMFKIGGFDEMMSPYIFEETDLSYRALKQGWKIIYEPRCIAYHELNFTIGREAGFFKKRVIGERNKLIFAWKNIHDFKMLFSNIGFLILGLLAFNPVKWAALFRALSNIKKIYVNRIYERAFSIRTDREILDFYGNYFNNVRIKE